MKHSGLAVTSPSWRKRLLNSNNKGILAQRIGELFQGLSPMTLMLVTAVLGGLLGAPGNLCGYMIAKLRK